MALLRPRTRPAFILEPKYPDEFVHTYGEIDVESQDEFRDAIFRAADSGERIVVDLTSCTYIGSKGLAVLFEASSKLTLAIIAPARMKRLIDLVGLSHLVIKP